MIIVHPLAPFNSPGGHPLADLSSASAAKTPLNPHMIRSARLAHDRASTSRAA